MNNRIAQMPPSASLVLMAKAKELKKQDPSIIGLAGGEPDFVTPDRVSMAAIRALAQGNTHYSLDSGIPELRIAIQKKLLRENGIEANAAHILLTPGAKYAIYLAIHAILNANDEVMILDPSWVSYEPIVMAAGGTTIKVKLDYKANYKITREALEAACSDKTRLLIINYPNNPTGRILHADEANILEAFLLEHPEIYLVSDEIYEKLVFDGKKSISMASFPSVRDRVITVNGFSKCAAMTGWRMGYLTANPDVFKAIYILYQHSLSCMSGFLQEGAVAVFQCEHEMEEMRKTYQERRDMFISTLNSTKGIHCVPPEGAFYAWVFFDVKGMTSEEICEYLMENAQVVGMPGTAYGETAACCMRFSIANATADLEKAAKQIKRAIEALD